MMAPQLDYQNDDALPCPERAQVEHWIATALAEAGAGDACELTVRIVASAEMQALNHRYRGIDSPTNVLAFEAELPPGIDLPLLGDIVICAPVVEPGAAQQGKPASAHWAHMAVHRALHLLLGNARTRPNGGAAGTRCEHFHRQFLAPSMRVLPGFISCSCSSCRKWTHRHKSIDMIHREPSHFPRLHDEQNVLRHAHALQKVQADRIRLRRADLDLHGVLRVIRNALR